VDNLPPSLKDSPNFQALILLECEVRFRIDGRYYLFPPKRPHEWTFGASKGHEALFFQRYFAGSQHPFFLFFIVVSLACFDKPAGAQHRVTPQFPQRCYVSMFFSLCSARVFVTPPLHKSSFSPFYPLRSVSPPWFPAGSSPPLFSIPSTWFSFFWPFGLPLQISMPGGAHAKFPPPSNLDCVSS